MRVERHVHGNGVPGFIHRRGDAAARQIAERRDILGHAGLGQLLALVGIGREIEESAGGMFLLVDMPEIATDPAPVRRVYRNAITRNRAWIALYQGWPAGYLIAKDLDGNLYLDQLSVDPDFAHKGIGAALIDHAEEVAKESGLPRLTMFTFAHVPWNAPYYQRLGFEQLPIERTLVVGYDALAANPAGTLSAISAALDDLGLDPHLLDDRQLATSHAALIGRAARPTLAEVVDGQVRLRAMPSLDEDLWTEDVHARVWPIVAELHRAMLRTFAGGYVAPPRPEHVPADQW